MNKKIEIDSVTILGILGIVLLVVLMVLPPLLRILVEDEPEEGEVVEKQKMTESDIESINKNGIVSCEKDKITLYISYKDEIVYQLKETTTYTEVSESDIDDCNNKKEYYSDSEGITGLCEYNLGNFVASFIFNYNTIEEDAKIDLPIQRDSNIKGVLKDYIKDGYSCYLK